MGPSLVFGPAFAIARPASQKGTQVAKFDPRGRKVKILATLGPASRSPEMIEKLLRAGADAFRVNMSHGDHATHAETIAAIRSVEKDIGRPIAVLCDLQGPKLRVGAFKDGRAVIRHGSHFTLDRDQTPGDETRVCLPHPELFGVLHKGQRLLIDDGKLRLKVISADDNAILCSAEVGGVISDRKGVNVPDAVVPVPALTEKDRRDLAFAVEHGADWIALSFVQRPEDVAEARKLMGGYGALMAKIEKPAAIDRLDEIIELSDGIMVARGDLGVELNPEEVPPLQKRIVAATRRSGKPVVVATQMLESMIESPAPTRAEVSDVANAVYDGADAVMLSAETASGAWPVEAVSIMDRIAGQVERDPGYRKQVSYIEILPDHTTADALAQACAAIAETVTLSGIIVFTGSGSTARRVARERPSAPMLVLTPSQKTARRMALLWGAHAVQTRDIGSFEEMIAKGKRTALRQGFGSAGSKLIALAGVPFGTPGSTNLLHIVTLVGDELKRHQPE
ncbi:MAG: pyruvate kinase [Sphingomonadales bacterium]|nr:pyruvate kinase [Sphingomonadales bacterium]